MRIGCYYRAFPGGVPIRSYYDSETQTVDGVPEDIIQLNNDAALYQFTSNGELVMATERTWSNIAETFGMFPEASLIIGDSMYHTFAITKTATFVYGFGSDERDKKMYNIDQSQKAHVLFPQQYRSIGFIKTFPEYYDWYQPVSLLNVFKYNNTWCIMTKDGIKPFSVPFDEKPNFATMSIMALAKSEDDVYGMFQQNGKNMFYKK